MAGPASRVVVGSGLDRPKLEQMKRLCRRLHADARTVVDAHTTHIVVQVIPFCRQTPPPPSPALPPDLAGNDKLAGACRRPICSSV